MSAREPSLAAMRSAAQQAHELVVYLLNGADDPRACADLARLANLIRAEAATQPFEELERLAESVATIAQAGVIDSQAAAELDAAVVRLLVLVYRATPATRVSSAPAATRRS